MKHSLGSSRCAAAAGDRRLRRRSRPSARRTTSRRGDVLDHRKLARRQARYLLDAYATAARRAYLFERARAGRARGPPARLRDYYNYAVQQSVTRLFSHYRDAPRPMPRAAAKAPASATGTSTS